MTTPHVGFFSVRKTTVQNSPEEQSLCCLPKVTEVGPARSRMGWTNWHPEVPSDLNYSIRRTACCSGMDNLTTYERKTSGLWWPCISVMPVPFPETGYQSCLEFARPWDWALSALLSFAPAWSFVLLSLAEIAIFPTDQVSAANLFYFCLSLHC